jgi:hypothetical protein
MANDGQRQRRALSAAEQALRALTDGDGERARRAAAEALQLDTIGAYRSLSGAVGVAADELDETGAVSPATWGVIARALGPGPLGAWAADRAGEH